MLEVKYELQLADELWPQIASGRRILGVKEGRVWVYIRELTPYGRRKRIKLSKWKDLKRHGKEVI